MFIFTVFDKKTPVHTSPFFAESNEVAIRAFYRLANNPQSDVNVFPGDFALYRIGKFDPDSGDVSPFIPVEHVVDAMSLIKLDKNGES